MDIKNTTIIKMVVIHTKRSVFVDNVSFMRCVNSFTRKLAAFKSSCADSMAFFLRCNSFSKFWNYKINFKSIFIICYLFSIKCSITLVSNKSEISFLFRLTSSSACCRNNCNSDCNLSSYSLTKRPSTSVITSVRRLILVSLSCCLCTYKKYNKILTQFINNKYSLTILLL